MRAPRSIDSICAAAGSDIPSAARPLTAPIYQNSVFEIESLEQVDDIYEGRQDGFIYSRDANPNVSILERVVSQTWKTLMTPWPSPPAWGRSELHCLRWLSRETPYSPPTRSTAERTCSCVST